MIDWSIAQSELLFYLYRSLDSNRAYASVSGVASRSGLLNYERVLIEELKSKKLIRGDQRTEVAGILSSLMGSANSYVLTSIGFDDIERELSVPHSHASSLKEGRINPSYFRHLLGDTKRDTAPAEKAADIGKAEQPRDAGEVVELDRDDAAYAEISQALDDLEREVAENNEAFAEDPNAREAALAEVRSLRTLWQSTFIRLEPFKVQADSVLHWVSEKGAAAVIVELCKHILKALIGWS